MANTSATGGYLTQTAGPTEGITFRRFIGTMLAGISGLSAANVRPMWQPNPPPTPEIDTNWLAFGIVSRKGDANPYMVEADDGSKEIMRRHEELEIQLIFYGPDCFEIAGKMRDGFSITQNTEAMQLAGMGFVEFGNIIHAPELVNNRFFERADATLLLRREVRRDYPVLNFLGSYGDIEANREITTLTRTWSVQPEGD